MKKTIKFTLRIKSELNPPDLGKGEGAGIIATQEMDYNEADIERYGEAMFAMKLIEVANNLRDQYITVTTEEIHEEHT